MRDIDRLLDLLKRTPFLAVDEKKARADGDAAALAYAHAVERWQGDVALALNDRAQDASERPCAFERIAIASTLSRPPAANLNDPDAMPAEGAQP